MDPHHGNKTSDDGTLGLGATHRFPRGKLNDNDEGEIRFAVAADRQNEKVVIDFGKPVTWLGMDADDARKLASMLKEKARECLGLG